MNSYIVFKNSMISRNQQGGDKIGEQLNRIRDGEFYLFSYGSNNITQLAERFNKETNNNLDLMITTIKDNSHAAIIPNMKRGFFSNSSKWNCSTATLINQNDGYVAGIALKITKINNNFTIGNLSINFRNLMINEAVNIGKYELQALQNLKLNKTNTIVEHGFAFIGKLNFRSESNSAEAKNLPSMDYLFAIAQMLKYRRTLLINNSNDDIDIDISLYQGQTWKNKAKISFKVDQL